MAFLMSYYTQAKTGAGITICQMQSLCNILVGIAPNNIHNFFAAQLDFAILLSVFRLESFLWGDFHANCTSESIDNI